ncbi:hypothetical protein [Gracilibacillus sp. YIM 98692]|uniref:hypothetical protein n=1 Tax=Gracilibacillus sp. YIM 98692 TaxID=2663532 RepID=UPI0032046C96
MHIKKGLVKVNFQSIEQPAYVLEEDDLISVRGKGRTKLSTFEGKTKKDKFRIRYAKLM